MAKRKNWQQRLAAETAVRLPMDFSQVLRDDYGVTPRDTFVPKRGKAAVILPFAAGAAACAAVAVLVLALTGKGLLPGQGPAPVGPGGFASSEGSANGPPPTGDAASVLCGRILEIRGHSLLLEGLSAPLKGSQIHVGGNIDLTGLQVGDTVEVTITGEIQETYPLGATATRIRKLPAGLTTVPASTQTQSDQPAAPTSSAGTTAAPLDKTRSFTAIVLEDGTADRLQVCGDFGQPIVQECDFPVTSTADLSRFKAGNRVCIYYAGTLTDPAPAALSVKALRVELIEEHVFTAWVLETYAAGGIRSMIVNDRRSEARIQVSYDQDLGDLFPGSFVRIVYDGLMASSYPGQVRAQRIDMLERASGRKQAKELRAEVLDIHEGRQLLVRSLDAKYSDTTFVSGEIDISRFQAGDRVLIHYQGYKTAGAPMTIEADAIEPLSQ